jgi:CRISPR/Cas system-associated exonuclease Cas4 (RecB family)|tara:strand:+ start:490 stop:1512 length:1023 start_codon:yes stop_codon:yes gene_type:complete
MEDLLFFLCFLFAEDLMKIRSVRAFDVPNKPGLKSTYGWHPGMPKDTILRVSKSSLGDHGFCQQQYFIKRVLGVKEPENDDMRRGTNVHDAVEEFYQEMNLSYALSMRSYGYDKVLEYFLNHIPKGPSEEMEFELGEEEHLRRYLTKEAQRFMTAEDECFLPIGNEVSLNAVVEIEGVLVHLTGIVDRLFADVEGRPHVHELKTGAWLKPDKKGNLVEKPIKRKSMREELAFYVYLLKQCDHDVLGGLSVEYWGWDHTGGEDIYRCVEPIRVDEISSMFSKLRELVRTHKSYTGNQMGSMFSLKDEGATKYICEPWCNVKGFCPRYYEPLKPPELRAVNE